MSGMYRNLDDVAAQLRSAGLMLETVKKSSGGTSVGDLYVESSRSVRCDVAGEKKKQTGAYRLHELRLNDGIWITGGYWIGHGNSFYKIELNKECEECGADMALKDKTCPRCGSKKSKKREFSPEQIEAHKKRMAELKRQAEAEAKAEADRAASWANAVWLKCREANEPTGPGDYIGRKQLKSGYGTRIFEGFEGEFLDGADNDDYEYLARFKGARVVPMCDENGRRRGLQFILDRVLHKDWISRRDGDDKTFWPSGMENDGLFFLIGGAMHRTGLVAEGIATAGSLLDETGIAVAVAFTAGNLPKVGERIWKSKKKRINLLYCADDDAMQRCQHCKKYTLAAEPACRHCGQPHGKSNAGVSKAQEAALATSGAWLIPQFSTPRPDDKKGPTDFNDLRCIEGPGPVRIQVEEKLAALCWNAPTSGSGAVSPEGGGGERSNAVSVISVDEAVERFMFVDEKTGEIVFDTVTREMCKRTKMINMLAARARGDDIKDHPLWKKRAIYIDQIGFDPAGEDKNITCNLWGGWPTVPKPGKCELLLELLNYQCSNEPAIAHELYSWVLRWLAYPIQHPGAKMQTAIIMHGAQGTGKGRFFEWGYMPIFGRYGVYLDQDALEDKHGSDWQSCKLFVLADEVLARAEMYHHKNKLKNLVTSRRIRINPKGLIAYEESNHLNIVFLSNEKQPLVLENDDRRYCVVWTPPPLGKEFYDDLSLEIANGGVEALHDYLLNQVDLGDFTPWTRPPMTEAKRDLINMSRDSVERFMIDWQAGDIEGLPFCPCGSADLYRAYLAWCRNNGERMPRPENQFSGHVIKLAGWQKAHKDIRGEDKFGVKHTKRVRMILPSQESLNESAARGGRDYRQKTGETITDWLTPCFEEFREAMRGDQ